MSFTVRSLREDKPKKPSRLLPLIARISKYSGVGMTLFRMIRVKRQQRKREEARINLLKRLVVILIAVLCGMLVLAGTVRALVSLKVLSLNSIVSVAGSDLPTDEYGHTNILLLGQGDESHDGVDLTDTIMLASIDPEETHSAVLLSLPRDLYFLETENMGTGRINSLYRDYKAYLIRQGEEKAQASRLAMQELADEIGRALNVEIHRVVKVDFIAFVQAVDAIGGVDIVVPEDLLDTEYPDENYGYTTFALNAGEQHLDGETALKYARSRHSTSDFDRSRRQQQILRAIADRVQSEGILTKPKQITELLNIMKDHVETTLQFREMVGLAGLAEDIDRENLITMQLNTQNGLYGSFSDAGGMLYNPPRDQFGGASVLLPVSIPEFPVTWKQIHALTTLLIHERVAHVLQEPITILNAGAAAGSARRLGGELIRYGFNVVTMENAEEDITISTISGNEESPTAVRLGEILGMPTSLTPTPSTESTDQEVETPRSFPVTIMLGEEYDYMQLQDAILPVGSTSPSLEQ